MNRHESRLPPEINYTCKSNLNMKLSVILSAVLLTITLLVGHHLKKRIGEAREHLQTLQETASVLQIPTSPDSESDTNEQQERLQQEKEVQGLMELSKEISQTFTPIGQSTEEDIEDRITLRAKKANALIPLTNFSHEKLDLFTKIIVRDPELDEGTRLTMLKQVLQIIAMEEPEIAANRVLQVADRLELEQKDSAPLIRSVVMEYILRKPFDASTWLLLNEEKLVSCFEDLKMNLLIRMTEKDPVSALELSGSLSSPNTNAYNAFGFGLTATNAETFFKALRKRSLSEKDQDMLYFGMTNGPFKHDFDSAVQVLDSEALTTAERERFFSALFFYRQLGSDDDLTKWLSYFAAKPKTDGFDPVSQINLLLPRFIERDYRSMGTWISDLPESSHKARWIQSYIRTVSPHDAAAATKFAKANK